MHFNPGNLNSNLLIFLSSKNLRTIRKMFAYKNFQEYSTCLLLAFFIVEGQLYVQDQSLNSSDDFGCWMNEKKLLLSDIS